jgi:hypothetical protein
MSDNRTVIAAREGQGLYYYTCRIRYADKMHSRDEYKEEIHLSLLLARMFTPKALPHSKTIPRRSARHG